MGPPGPPLFFSTAIRPDLPNSHVPGLMLAGAAQMAAS